MEAEKRSEKDLGGGEVRVCLSHITTKIKAPLGSTNPMYCTCAMKPFANAAVSTETH